MDYANANLFKSQSLNAEFKVPIALIFSTLIGPGKPTTQTIIFTGLEPITDTVDYPSGAGFSIRTNDADDTIRIDNGPDVGGMPTVQIGFDGAYEAATYNNKSFIGLHTLGGQDTVRVDVPNPVPSVPFIQVDAGEESEQDGSRDQGTGKPGNRRDEGGGSSKTSNGRLYEKNMG